MKNIFAKYPQLLSEEADTLVELVEGVGDVEVSEVRRTVSYAHDSGGAVLLQASYEAKQRSP